MLAIAALYAAALLMVLVLATLMLGGKAVGSNPDLGLVMAVALPLTLAIMVLVPVLLGGLMHVIRETEAGRVCVHAMCLRRCAARRAGGWRGWGWYKWRWRSSAGC